MMRSEFITFRASDKELDYLEWLAKHYGVNKSELLRFMIRKEAIMNKIDHQGGEVIKDQVLTNV